MKKRIVIIGLLGLALSVWRLPGAVAAEEHEHKEGKAKMPDTVGGIWAEVKEHEEELGKTISGKKLDKVHEVAFEIRDLVNALPDKSKDLAADKLAKVKANAKYVADIAKRLDESGDAKDQAATEANFKKLQGFLKTIEAQYPPETLKAGEKEKSEIHRGMEQAYACPMHPEVVSDKPGKCPKCGMNLVAKAAEPHEHGGHEAHSAEKAHADHDAKHGGMFGMQGDYHYELVERDGEFRAYVYDAYTKPISVKGLTGSVEISESPDKITTLPLSPTANDTYLVAPMPKGADPAEATLKLDLPGEKLKITLPLRITLKGRVVDVACFAKDGAAALERSHDECAKACIAAGSPVGILMGDDVHSPLYLVTIRGEGAQSKAANDKLVALANQQVHVTGKLIQRDKLKIIELTDVQPASAAEPKH